MLLQWYVFCQMENFKLQISITQTVRLPAISVEMVLMFNKYVLKMVS